MVLFKILGLKNLLLPALHVAHMILIKDGKRRDQARHDSCMPTTWQRIRKNSGTITEMMKTEIILATIKQNF